MCIFISSLVACVPRGDSIARGVLTAKDGGIAVYVLATCPLGVGISEGPAETLLPRKDGPARILVALEMRRCTSRILAIRSSLKYSSRSVVGVNAGVADACAKRVLTTSETVC
eukprot:2282162-Pleurochrysis_carterae.AAC.1